MFGGDFDLSLFSFEQYKTLNLKDETDVHLTISSRIVGLGVTKSLITSCDWTELIRTCDPQYQSFYWASVTAVRLLGLWVRLDM